MKRATFIKSVAIGALWLVGVRPKPYFALASPKTVSSSAETKVLIRDVWQRLDIDGCNGHWMLTQYGPAGNVVWTVLRAAEVQ